MVLLHIHVLFAPMGSDFAPPLLGGEEELMLDMVVPKRDRIQEAGCTGCFWMFLKWVAQSAPSAPIPPLWKIHINHHQCFNSVSSIHINPRCSIEFHWIYDFSHLLGLHGSPKLKVSLNVATAVTLEAQKQGLAGKPLGDAAEVWGKRLEDMWRACSDVATCCYSNLAGGFLVSYLSMPTLDALGWSPTERYFEMAGSTASHEICFGGKVLGVLLDLWMQMCSRVRKWGPYHWLVCSFGACAAGAVATVRATVGVFSCWQCLWCGAAEYAYKCYQSLW